MPRLQRQSKGETWRFSDADGTCKTPGYNLTHTHTCTHAATCRTEMFSASRPAPLLVTISKRLRSQPPLEFFPRPQQQKSQQGLEETKRSWLGSPSPGRFALHARAARPSWLRVAEMENSRQTGENPQDQQEKPTRGLVPGVKKLQEDQKPRGATQR